MPWCFLFSGVDMVVANMRAKLELILKLTVDLLKTRDYGATDCGSRLSQFASE